MQYDNDRSMKQSAGSVTFVERVRSWCGRPGWLRTKPCCRRADRTAGAEPRAGELERMQERGVITGYGSEVDLAAPGYMVHSATVIWLAAQIPLPDPPSGAAGASNRRR
jgi:hypothetical protein